MGREGWGGSSDGVAEETVDRRAGKAGGLFGLDEGRYDDNEEGPVLELAK